VVRRSSRCRSTAGAPCAARLGGAIRPRRSSARAVHASQQAVYLQLQRSTLVVVFVVWVIAALVVVFVVWVIAALVVVFVAALVVVLVAALVVAALELVSFAQPVDGQPRGRSHPALKGGKCPVLLRTNPCVEP
jgi:hypothetical protein